MSEALHHLFARSAAQDPQRIAVVDAAGAATYAEVDALAHRIGRALRERGVVRGDRVGIWLEKSRASVAAMQAILRAGAAYVPLDLHSPPARIGKIVRDCDLRLVVTDRALDDVACFAIASAPDGEDRLEPVAVMPGDLAYVLYTSGSTGTPKGVCISHRGARAFVDWAAAELALTKDDRLSSHAPFHFDLSVLDLYGAFSVGATVCLVPEAIAYMPQRLVAFVAEQRITVWYSVPSALALMLDQGEMSELSSLRTIVFAGETFPMKQLRRLRAALPDVRLLNFYGPTETNVCTFHEVMDLAPEQTSIPIGRASSGDEVWAVRPDGTTCVPGEEGELFVSGPSVMLGYWGQPPQDGPYATGDVVRVLSQGVFELVGRRDRLVKVRGHRIELGDVEAALAEHEDVREVAVVVRGEGPEARLVACVVPARDPAPSLLTLKGHSAQRLPRYMILDELRVLPRLPRTTNGKLDHALLLATDARE